MSIKKISIASIIFILLIHSIVGQAPPIEVVVKEINRQIFDTDGQLPGFWTLTNKYHENNFGKIKAETILYPNDEKVFRQFNLFGNMVKREVYRQDKLNDDFTYEYAENGIRLISERGTYNLDYFQIDSINFMGVNSLGNGIGFTFDLDTVFVQESLHKYELTRKKKSKTKPIDKFDFKYNRDGSLLSVTIYKNNVQIGHMLNKYNDLKQVIERQDFWDYDRFANEDEWSEYLSNRLYKFSYDSIGFIQSLTTEIYSPITRNWDIQIRNFECSLQPVDNGYKAKCNSGQEEYFIIQIDQYGNWIRKEEHEYGEIRISTRDITYYE